MVESLRTSSKTQFEVFGLGLEACKSLKMPCPRLEDSTLFWPLENGLRSWPTLFHHEERQKACKNFFEDIFFLGERLKFLENLQNFGAKTFFFQYHFRVVSLVLGLDLEHSCPLPWGCLSSEGRSLALDFFCVLGLGLASSTLLLIVTKVTHVKSSRFYVNKTEQAVIRCRQIDSSTQHGCLIAHWLFAVPAQFFSIIWKRISKILLLQSITCKLTIKSFNCIPKPVNLKPRLY